MQTPIFICYYSSGKLQTQSTASLGRRLETSARKQRGACWLAFLFFFFFFFVWFFFWVFFFFFGCARGMWKFQSHSSDNIESLTTRPPGNSLDLFVYLFIYSVFLGPHPRHVDVSRLGVTSEL